jgi:hypothetical protein
MSTFLFTEFPIPPSENNCYPSFYNKRLGKMMRFPSRELKAFKTAAAIWAKGRAELISQARVELLPAPRAQIRVDLMMGFEPGRLFTKDGRRKKLDASNRIKPIHDALAEILGIDDRFFYTGQSEAVLADGGGEWVLIRLSKDKIRPMSVAMAETLAFLKKSDAL